MQAYSLPDRGVRRAIRNACARGVKVQMLLAGTTDVPVVRYASRAMYASLMKWGVEIYEWYDTVLHAKAAVVDGCWYTVGSFNMDRRSLKHNLEINIAGVDHRIGEALEQQFEGDMQRAVRVDAVTWPNRPFYEKVFEQICFKLRFLL